MSSSVLGTSFEMSLRILLLLSAGKVCLTADMLVLADLLTAYGANFGITKINLHGDNNNPLDELAARRAKITEAIKILVLRNFIDVIHGENGFYYSISKNGAMFIRGNVSEYAVNYRTCAKSVIRYVKGKTEREVFALISTKGGLND